MSDRPFVVLTTRLPPQTCGIGTYSWLANHHRPEGSAPAKFIVIDGAKASRSYLSFDEIFEFTGNPRNLEKALPEKAANLLVHYAGRAFHKLGCPVWLPQVLSQWKAKFPQSRITIFFHELPGSVPWWSRHYLFGKLEHRIVGQLALLADVILTNTENHVALLREVAKTKDIHFLPVSSNIEALPADSEPRVRTEFVILGLPFGRLQTLQIFDEEIRRWQRDDTLTTLHIVGPDDDKFSVQANRLIAQWPKPASVMRHGLLPEAEVAKLLSKARFALTNATPATWSKSSVFMAAAVTGCVVVMKRRDPKLVPLSFTVDPGEVDKITEADLTNVSGSLKAWYDENADWKVTGNRIASLAEAGREAA